MVLPPYNIVLIPSTHYTALEHTQQPNCTMTLPSFLIFFIFSYEAHFYVFLCLPPNQDLLPIQLGGGSTQLNLISKIYIIDRVERKYYICWRVFECFAKHDLVLIFHSSRGRLLLWKISKKDFHCATYSLLYSLARTTHHAIPSFNLQSINQQRHRQLAKQRNTIQKTILIITHSQ